MDDYIRVPKLLTVLCDKVPRSSQIGTFKEAVQTGAPLRS